MNVYHRMTTMVRSKFDVCIYFYMAAQRLCVQMTLIKRLFQNMYFIKKKFKI